MNTYKVTNYKLNKVIGTYQAENEDKALDAMARSFNFDSFNDLRFNGQPAPTSQFYAPHLAVVQILPMRVTFDHRWDEPGWIAWAGAKRGWQPIVGCEDPKVIPTLEEACACDPTQYFDPDSFSGVEVVNLLTGRA